LLYLIVSSVIAAIVSFIAYDVFGANALHGFFSADVFCVLLIWRLPQKSKFKYLLIAASIVLTVFFNPVIGLFSLVVVLASFIPKKNVLVSVLFFVCLLLFVVLADASNFFHDAYFMSLNEFWGIASFYWWGGILYCLVPVAIVFATYQFSKKNIWKASMDLKPCVFLLSVALLSVINPFVFLFQHRLPFVEFSLAKCFWKHNIYKPFDLSKGIGEGVSGEELDRDIKYEYPIWRDTLFLDAKTVSILVESFGVNRDVSIAKRMISYPFRKSNVTFLGLVERHTMFTHGAELEDLGHLERLDSSQASFLKEIRQNGGQSYYLHGYQGAFYSRLEKYPKFGFDNFWAIETLGMEHNICDYGFKGVCDEYIVGVIDSLLTDSVPKFVYWTTLDSHPPYKDYLNLSSYSIFCKNSKISEKQCIYLSLIENTLNKIAVLAQKHPDYKFIIRGDHRPMATVNPNDFYFGWVPMIILN